MANRYHLHKLYTLLKAVPPDALRQFCRDQAAFSAALDGIDPETDTARLIDRVVRLAQSQAAFDPLLAWLAETTPPAYQAAEPLTFEADPETELNPYPGLLPFREADAPYFYGRDQATNRLATLVKQAPLAALVGPPGSGKSSLVYAGLLPALRWTGDWLVADFRPRDEPYLALAQALLPLYEAGSNRMQTLVDAPTLAKALQTGSLSLPDALSAIRAGHPDWKRFLLIVDQFGELFTHLPDPTELRRFLDALLSPLRTATDTPPINLVLTLRTDFLTQAMAYPPLANALRGSLETLETPRPDELQAAIERPALMRGYLFEPGLAPRILNDATRETEPLPRLQATLHHLWLHREDGQLTHQAYDAGGRVQRTLVSQLNAAFDSLSAAEQDQAQTLLLRLIDPGPPPARRLLKKGDLDADAWSLLEKLAAGKLVTLTTTPSGEVSAELRHESLIWAWPRLREWLEYEQTFLTWRDRLRTAYQYWAATGRMDEALLQGARQAEAESWLAERAADLDPAEQDFIRAGAGHQPSAPVERPGTWYAWLWKEKIAVVAILIALIMAGLGWFGMTRSQAALLQADQANQGRGQAQEQAATATSALAVAHQEGTALAGERDAAREQVATAIAALETSLEQGTAVAAQATASVGSVATAVATMEAAMITLAEEHATAQAEARIALSQRLAIQAQVQLSARPALALLLALEGQQLADTPETRQVIAQAPFFGLPLGRELVGHQGRVWEGAWSPDGERLATASADGTVILWDGESGQPLQQLVGHSAAVLSVDWAPDGERLAAAAADGAIIIWDAATGETLQTLDNAEAGVNSLAWSPVAERLAAALGDGTILILETDTGELEQTVAGHEGSVLSVDWAPTGDRLASAAVDGTVIIWEGLRFTPAQTLEGHEDGVFSVAWSPEGNRLASGGADGTIIIWSRVTASAVQTLQGHQGAVLEVAWSPGGDELASASADRSVIIWNPTAGQAVSALRGHRDWVLGVAWSPAGAGLASTSADGTAFIWDPAAKIGMRSLRGHTAAVLGLAWSPDGSRLASASEDGTVVVWDVETETALSVLTVSEEGVLSVDWSPDGSRLAAGAVDGLVTLWDVQSGEQVGTLTGHEGRVMSVAWSPDGTRLASGAEDGTAIIWDPAAGSPLTTLSGHQNGLSSVAWSPDGTQLASGSWDTTVVIWDAETGEGQAVLGGQSGRVSDVTWSPDGTRLAATSANNLVTIWDPATGDRVRNLQGHQGIVWEAAWSPDGSRLASASSDRTILLISDAYTRPPCEQATRNLTAAEWQLFLPSRPYHATCPNLPALARSPES